MGDSPSSPSTVVSIPNGTEFADGDEPPSSAPRPPSRHPAWADVPETDWNDWRWQSQHAVRHPRQLVDLLPFTEDERRAIETLQTQYKLAIPPYYFSLIDPSDPRDPIRLQSVPSPLELAGAAGADGEDDPLDEDKDSPVPGLTHRYPDRALLVTTHVCTMYCRFCTRKRATMKRGGWDAVSHDDRRMVEYVRDHPEIHDVIISGGDPLTLPLEKLAFFVENLTAIPHLDVIRIGTRVPVTLPQRLDDDDLIDAARRLGQDLDPDPLQPPARGDPGGEARLRPAPDGRDADQQSRRAAQGGQRQPGHPARRSAGRCSGSRSAPTTCSTATPSPAPATSARRSGRGSRSSKGSAGTSPAWASRPTSSTPPGAGARSP